MDTIALLTELVSIDSTNSTLDPDGPGEAAMAARLGELLDELGFAVTTHEVAPGRPNVLGVLAGDPTLPTLMLEAHLDTVPSPPGGIPIRRDGDRLYGRGSCDCKGALAAMLSAISRIVNADAPFPTLLVAGVVDEETAMTGSAALLALLPPVTGAVIAEPTSLLPVRAHNGVMRVGLTAHGRAAHAATAHLGVNAVTAAARAVDALDRELVRRLASTAHLLTGPATLTPTVIRGGIAPNIVPDSCEVILDRRTAPGTTMPAALAEIEAVLEPLRRAGDDLRLGVPFVSLPSVETPADDPIVAAAERAASGALGRSVTAGGVAFATDACHLFGEGGIPSVVLGPGSIDQAHTIDEWVDLGEVETAVAIYEGIVREFTRAGCAGALMGAHAVGRVVPLTYGWEHLPKSISVHGADPSIRLREPVPGVLLELDGGWLLLDVGFNDSAVLDAEWQRQERGPEWETELVRPGDSLDAAFEVVGVDPADVVAVAVSHFHYDHAGGLRHFAGRVPVYAQRAELAYVGATGDADLEAHAYFRHDFVDPAIDWHPLDGDVEFVPGVTALHTAGHTPGHQSFAVDVDERHGGRGFVFAFDAADLQENIDDELAVGTMIDVDPEETVESIRRLKAIAAERGYRLVPGHDPDAWPALTADLGVPGPA